MQRPAGTRAETGGGGIPAGDELKTGQRPGGGGPVGRIRRGGPRLQEEPRVGDRTWRDISMTQLAE
jgi:hypothetical protein